MTHNLKKKNTRNDRMIALAHKEFNTFMEFINIRLPRSQKMHNYKSTRLMNSHVNVMFI